MAGHFALACVLLSTLAFQPGYAGKVLIVPFHHRSHINIFRNLGQVLSDDGHEVIILASDKWSEQLEGYTFEHLAFNVPKEADFNVPFVKAMQEDPTGKTVLEKILAKPWPHLGWHCDALLTNEAIMKRIKNERFDLAIMDGAPALPCTYTVPYKFDIPYITFHGMNTLSWAAGVTGLPSREPDPMLEISNRMNFWERLTNLKVWIQSLDDPWMILHDQRFQKTYVPEKPFKKFSDIMKDSEMFLLNYDVTCLDYPRVSAPNYQYLGPSSVAPTQPLPQHIDEFVQGAEHGVVIMSLGSFKAWQYAWLPGPEGSVYFSNQWLLKIC